MATAAPAIAAPEITDACCDLCGAIPFIATLDGDKVCAACFLKYPSDEADYYGHAPDADEIADLQRSMRGAGVYRGALIEARLTDAQLVAHGLGQRRFARAGGV